MQQPSTFHTFVLTFSEGEKGVHPLWTAPETRSSSMHTGGAQHGHRRILKLGAASELTPSVQGGPIDVGMEE